MCGVLFKCSLVIPKFKNKKEFCTKKKKKERYKLLVNTGSQKALIQTPKFQKLVTMKYHIYWPLPIWDFNSNYKPNFNLQLSQEKRELLMNIHSTYVSLG